MPDEELVIEIVAEDDYTDTVKDVRKETDELSDSMEDARASTEEANIAFLAQMQALEGVSSGYNQVFGGVQDLGLVNEQQIEQLRKIKGALDLTIGSLKLYSVAAEHLGKLNVDLLIPSLIGTAAAAGGIAFAMMAANAASEEERLVFAALTGVSFGLAAASFTLAAAQSSVRIAEAGILAPVVAAAIVGGLAFALTAIATQREEAMNVGTVPAAQTSPGQARMVDETGLALVHEGEEISRPSSISAPSFGRGGGTTVILQGVYDLSTRGGVESIADRVAPVLRSKDDRRGRTIR